MTPSDEERAQVLRRQFPVLRRSAYLNAGTNGPLPKVVRAAVADSLRRQYRRGRIGREAFREHQAAGERVRELASRLLGADPAELALTHHTTEGMNIAAWGLPWRQGDRVLTTDQEHPGGLLPLAGLRRRLGVEVDFLQAADLAADPAGAVEAAITPRTRLLAFSHVSYRTGEVLPAAAMIRAAHGRGVPALVDGAQAVGAIPVDLAELGADFYALPGQKWLCGPEGTGLLYVDRRQWSHLRQTFLGYLSIRDLDEAGEFLPQEGARRYEVGFLFLPSLAGLAAALEFFLEQVGPAWAYRRIAALREEARRLLSGPGVEFLTPPAAAGILSFRVEGLNPEKAVSALARKRVMIRSIERPACLRVAAGYYNTPEDLERLAEGLAALRR